MKSLAAAALALLTATTVTAAGLPARSADPYLGAIVVDAVTGDVLYENHADVQGYPASVIKLMDLLVILEKIEEGALKLDDLVTVTAESSTIGGSQVYLKEHEVFSVDDLLYAMVVQSANDAATALAIHVAGTKDGFVDLMNEKAQAIGMKSTVIHSVHGLPPSADQEPDLSSPRDIALLCSELLKHKDTLRYTATAERGFRNDTFMMRNHNPLITTFQGCDGFKTGYYTKAGFSIAATATRKDDRVIAVIMGSLDKKIRNAKAAELLSKGFMEIGKKRSAQEKPPQPTPAN
jgi:serine-type D-Ala-D-Ala carboxypeptidase (penicillin-binding protein 5/6)